MTKALVPKLSQEQIALLVTALVAMSGVAWLVANYSVNVPVSDEWLILGLVEKIQAGQASFWDFYALHNEHRLVFPKLIFVLLAFASQWNVRYEMYLSIVLAGMTLVMISYLSLLSHPQLNPQKNRAYLAVFISTLSIFSWVQLDNWLWGFQMAWFLVNACLVAAVLIIRLSQHHPRNHYFAAIPCLIASFSLAHGLFSWLAVLPSIAALEGHFQVRLKRILIWLILFAITAGLYSIGYGEKTGDLPSVFFFLEQPIATLQYLFNLLGAGLTGFPATRMTLLLGMFILGCFVLLSAYFIRHAGWELKIDPAVAPWLSISLFSLFFAVVTTIARAGFGDGQAATPRYTTVSLLLVISVIHLWQLLPYKNSFFFVSGIVTVLLINSSMSSIPYIENWREMRQIEEACLELTNSIDFTNRPELCPTFMPPQINELGNSLERVGFRKFPEQVEFVRSPTRNYGRFSINLPVIEGAAVILPRTAKISILGWAILPQSQTLPKLVFLTYGINDHFFSSAVINLPSPEIEKRRGSLYSHVRWRADFSLEAFPKGQEIIQAWVYDSDNKKLVKLNGDLAITVES